jgi:hypothetical protein
VSVSWRPDRGESACALSTATPQRSRRCAVIATLRAVIATLPRKDRAQDAFLIRVLAEKDNYALADAWISARAKGPAWCSALDAAFARCQKRQGCWRDLIKPREDPRRPGTVLSRPT